jgi:hypothetical protein
MSWLASIPKIMKILSGWRTKSRRRHCRHLINILEEPRTLQKRTRTWLVVLIVGRSLIERGVHLSQEGGHPGQGEVDLVEGEVHTVQRVVDPIQAEVHPIQGVVHPIQGEEHTAGEHIQTKVYLNLEGLPQSRRLTKSRKSSRSRSSGDGRNKVRPRITFSTMSCSRRRSLNRSRNHRSRSSEDYCRSRRSMSRSRNGSYRSRRKDSRSSSSKCRRNISRTRREEALAWPGVKDGDQYLGKSHQLV